MGIGKGKQEKGEKRNCGCFVHVVSSLLLVLLLVENFVPRW
jgi:hypothetical protein